MQALVDKLAFTASGGTIVHMRKRLGWRADAPPHRLTEQSPPPIDASSTAAPEAGSALR
jgi:hypothetical protein